MLKSSSKSKLNILDVLLILIVFYTVMPIVSRFISSYLTTYFYMAVLLLVVLLVFSCNGNKSFNSCLVTLFPFLCWKAIQLFILKGSIILWGYVALVDLIPIVIGCYVTNYCDDKKNDVFLKIIILLFIITAATTIIGCSLHPGASRYLATVDDAKDANAVLYGWLNIGGYEFVYMAVLLHPIMILAYKKGKVKIWMAIATSVLTFFLCIYSEYTTALLLTLVTFLLYFLKKDLTRRQLIALVVFSIATLTIFAQYISDFLMWLSEIIESKTLSSRLQALAIGREGISASDNRIAVYQASINTFLKNPLFGTVFSGGVGTGGHSFILDFIAQFGLVGLAILVFLYRSIYKRVFVEYKNQQGYGYVLWIFIQTIMLSTVNTGAWLVVLMFVAPISFRAIFKEDKSENSLDS